MSARARSQRFDSGYIQQCINSQLARAISEIYKECNSLQMPAWILNLQLPSGTFDVNVTPDKRIIMVQDERSLIERAQVRL